MAKEFWTVAEVVEIFEVDEGLLEELEEEEVLCPLCRDDPPVKLFSSAEMEKLRLAKLLIDDMGVNIPGVEIILRMRQSIYEMRRQFDDILEDLAGRLRDTLGEKS